MEKISLTSILEDYLEAIAEIIEKGEHAHAKEIADRLQVKMPSVSNALQALSARGLILYQTHCPVRLTAAGAEYAAVIRHRHTALQEFFSKVLMLEPGEAGKSACEAEHILGEKAISRIVLLSDAIESREDCAGLRAYIEKTMPEICPETAENLISLDKLEEGERGVVVRVAESLRGLRKFADLGLIAGTLLELEGVAPFGDLLRIKVMGSSLSLRKRDAAYIWVRPAGKGEASRI